MPHEPPHFSNRKTRTMWPVTLCFILSPLCILGAEKSSTAVSREVADATDIFSVDLFKEVLKENNGNVVISPMSVSTLLSLLQQGSGGDTEAQLTQTLHLDSNQSRQGYSKLTRNLKESSGNETLEFTNGAFLDEEFQIRPAFREIATDEFLATVDKVVFSESISAAEEINSWVANHTHDKIQKLVSPDDLDSTTRLVLVNAIYYKNFWKIAFQKDNTRNEVFYVDGDTIKEVSTMQLRTKLLTGYEESLKSRWLQIPFQGDRFHLLIILPDDYNGVDSVANSLTGSELSDIIHNGKTSGYYTDVQLSLPKFKLETNLELVSPLEKLGLTDVFTYRANLSGISAQNLYVSQVVQKAQIEVDEEGATAAAATAVIGIRITAVAPDPPPPLPFVADHPFFVVLVDNSTKLPLFISRVTDPAAS